MATRSTRSTVAHAPTKSNDVTAWQDQAACYPWDFKKDGDPFFPDSTSPAAAHQAQAICSSCRVKDFCRAYAETTIPTLNDGIFGGTTAEDRQRERRRRSRLTDEARKETTPCKQSSNS